MEVWEEGLEEELFPEKNINILHLKLDLKKESREGEMFCSSAPSYLQIVDSAGDKKA